MDNPRQTRRHDLDALRGAAMLCGIAFHTTFAFFSWPGPVHVDGADESGFYDEFFHASHGFRMPLFFLLSGYFTTLLASRRGIRALLEHRVKRILLPLAAAAAILVPVLNWLIKRIAEPGFTPGSAITFHHLWFLWFLWWFAVGYGVLVSMAYRARRLLATSLGYEPNADWLATSAMAKARLGMMALAPVVSFVAQSQMGNSGVEPTFGPDIRTGLVAEAHVVIYYAAFFAFGALSFGPLRTCNDTGTVGRSSELVDRISTGWRFVLPASVFIIGPLAFAATFGTNTAGLSARWILAALLQTGYTWGMIVGLIGLTGALLASERIWVRYLSDASYWLYLVHLPLVMAGYWWVADWPVSRLAKFMIVFGGTIGIGMVTYAYAVRYTPIGRFLNGPRVRPVATVHVRHQSPLLELGSAD